MQQMEVPAFRFVNGPWFPGTIFDNVLFFSIVIALPGMRLALLDH